MCHCAYQLIQEKSGVHSVMSPRQLLFRKKFKTLLCKMGELVLEYDVQSNNKTSKPRALYALYVRPNDGGTSHSVFKLSTKSMIATPRCNPVPMSDDVIKVVNQIGEDDRSPDGIVFCNIHKELTVDNMYGDVDSQDNSSCASDKSWNMWKDGGQEDQKIIMYDDDVDDNEVDDLNEDLLHLRNGLRDNINNGNNKHEYIK